MAEAKALGYLELNIAGFDQAIKTAEKLLAGFVAAFSAVKLEQFFEKGIEGAIKFGDEMFHASQKLGGFDPGNLLLVQKALENTGESAESAQKIISDALHEGRNLSDIFKGSDNYAKALQNASASYGSQAKVLSASAEKLSKVWEILQSVGSKIQTFFISLTAQFVKPLQVLLEYINKIDLAGIGSAFGEKIGEALTLLIGAFSSGTIYDLLATGLKLAFAEGANLFIEKSVEAVDWIQKGLGTAFFNAAQFLETVLTEVFKDSIWGTLWDSFLAVTYKITAALLRAFETPILYFKSGIQWAIETAVSGLVKLNPNLAKILGLSDFKASSFQDIKEQQGQASLFGTSAKDYDKLGDQKYDAIQGKITDGLNKAFEQFDKKNLNPNELFQTGELKKSFTKLVQDALKAGKAISNATDSAKISKNEEIKGDPARIIADSFAKIGGGGGYIRQGQTLQEKQLTMQTRAAKASEETARFAAQTAKNTATKPSTAKIPRE